MTSTSSVVRPRCTSTLSITTWKNSGLTSANSCRNSETSSTSPSSLRYLTMAGDEPAEVELGQLAGQAGAAGGQQQLACPPRLAGAHCLAKTSTGSMVGRPPPSAPVSWNSTRWPSHWASRTQRSRPSSPISLARAGKAAMFRRSGLVRETLDLRPRCLAARSRSVSEMASLGGMPSWCARAAGSAAMWCRRASRHSMASAGASEPVAETSGLEGPSAMPADDGSSCPSFPSWALECDMPDLMNALSAL